jgi:predicted secreted Zn-dependent protease
LLRPIAKQFIFFLRVALAIGLAGALTLPSVAEPKLQEIRETYFIQGRTVETLIAAIKQGGPPMDPAKVEAGLSGFSVARTKPTFTYRPELQRVPNGCRVIGATVSVIARIVMPDWINRGDASTALQQEWERYHADVLAHERGHVAIALEAARRIERGILGLTGEHRCDDVPKLVRSIAQEEVRRQNEEQAEFDRREGSCALRKSCLRAPN